MARKREYDIVYPTTEAGWFELGGKIAAAAKPANVAPRPGEIKRVAGTARKHNDKAGVARQTSLREEQLAQNDLEAMKKLVRRRAQAVKATLGDAGRVQLIDEGYRVRDTSDMTPAAPEKNA